MPNWVIVGSFGTYANITTAAAATAVPIFAQKNCVRWPFEDLDITLQT